MRKSMVVGNWKMNGSKSFVNDLLKNLQVNSLAQVELVVCPPFVFLQEAQQLLENGKIKLGAQNLYPANQGAFTGEISPAMLKEFNCHYVILGHSERRQLFNETNQFIASKFNLAWNNGLLPILCVGETEQERQNKQTFEVIESQLKMILDDETSRQALSTSAIAYEPVWAIGTGLTATPEQANEVHAFIRQEVAKVDKSLAEKVRILYGGSVKPTNAKALFSMPDIDGGLIGGASLNANEFLEIATSCNSH